MAPSSALQPYVWACGMTTGRIATAPLIIKSPARPKQLLTFFFEDGYRTLRPNSSETDASPRVVVVAPQSQTLPGVSVGYLHRP